MLHRHSKAIHYSKGSLLAKDAIWSFKNSTVTLASFPLSSRYFELPAEYSTLPTWGAIAIRQASKNPVAVHATSSQADGKTVAW